MAGAFRFGLAKVLEMREQREQEMKRLLGEALARLDEQQRQLALLERTRDEYRDEVSRLQKGAVDVAMILTCLDFLDKVATSITEQAERVVSAQEHVEEARRRLVIASQEKKAIEKLRERHFEAWQKEQSRVETNALDEASQQRFNRRAAARDDAGGGP